MRATSGTFECITRRSQSGGEASALVGDEVG